MAGPRPKLSAFVVSFNRPELLGTCLRGIRFADEVIVVDKSSSEETRRIAGNLADRVITVPWSPTVEETRAFAAAQCSHEWILFLDDDECLDPAAVRFLQAELEAPQADAYAFPLRHYILGVHDERAYYWPEHHVRCFRRGAVAFGETVHAGLQICSGRVLRIGTETGVCIHHLSHQDASQWIEKANRYTSRPDRARVAHSSQDLTAFAHERIDHWIAQTRDVAPGEYPSVVALLRAVYDMIDRVKTWEEETGLDGAARFRAVCAALDATRDNPAALRCAVESDAAPMAPADDPVGALRDHLRTLRAQYDTAMRERDQVVAAAQAERTEALWVRQEAELVRVEAEAARASAEAVAQTATVRTERVTAALHAIESSTFWRATAWPRSVVGHLQRRR